jgi:hypothetical protein
LSRGLLKAAAADDDDDTGRRNAFLLEAVKAAASSTSVAENTASVRDRNEIIDSVMMDDGI